MGSAASNMTSLFLNCLSNVPHLYGSAILNRWRVTFKRHGHYPGRDSANNQESSSGGYEYHTRRTDCIDILICFSKYVSKEMQFPHHFVAMFFSNPESVAFLYYREVAGRMLEWVGYGSLTKCFELCDVNHKKVML